MPPGKELEPLEQTAAQVIVVRPTGFGFDPLTAASNGFQKKLADPGMARKAEVEFDALVKALTKCGIGVTVLDPTDPDAPDAVFPNNWFSTDSEGRMVYYPMATASRRRERDLELHRRLMERGFASTDVFDVTHWEAEGHALEGTGSLVLDRTKRTAYAALSHRTTREAVEAWCQELGFKPMTFAATMDGKADGQTIYHTNVMMTIGDGFAVLCAEAIPDLNERHRVAAGLASSGKELVQINLEQMHGFAGNILQLRGRKGSFIFLSERAFKAFDAAQIHRLGRHGELVPVPIPTIETVGGGSIRCMLAENFLPLRP
ncbi:MAG TPA: arginine deiminase-related protein [Flavobacteriales bacterium]|nr:arginine deiminase-related protein [Flavobacteriales bacterium]